MIAYIIGPSGCGKSVVGRAVSEALGAVFLDADDFHSAEARSKMARGLPLTDGERAPWLQRVRDAAAAAEGDAVVACSALKRAYREVLRGGGRDVRFVALQVGEAELRRRVGGRHAGDGHFMPESQVVDQLRTWETPAAGEPGAAVVSGEHPIPEVVDAVVALLR